MLEANEQKMLMEWSRYSEGRCPELALLFHIPNGGSRNALEAKNLKAQGVKSGVPDLFLPVARNGFHGLFIEMKRSEGGRVSAGQTSWINELKKQGYCAWVCKGFEEAKNAIENYLVEV